jgi:hypothetical protein
MSGTYDGEWQLIKETPFERVWLQAIDATHYVCKRETLAHSAIAESNAATLKATEGQKFGEGRLVARVPLDIWHKHLAEATAQGDHKFKAKWLNSSENAHWRTFKGNL